MSRKTRYLKSVNEYFHLFNRGVNREQIFFKRSDYTSFIDRMTRCLDRSLLAIIAYCLMPNHFHIVVLQKVPYAMADFMKGVCQEHAKRINAWLDRKRPGWCVLPLIGNTAVAVIIAEHGEGILSTRMQFSI